MQVAFSSVNRGSNVYPRRVKNSTLRGRFFTGRLTKICLAIAVSFVGV